MLSAFPNHNCISTIHTLSDIWLYNGKEIQEQVAPVSNNAATGSVIKNLHQKWIIYLGMAVLSTLCVLWHVGF